MICDTLEHLSLYQGFHKNLDTAITFLTACDLNALPLGRTEVDGENVFINVMDADLQPMEGSHPEYHRLYADLQLDLTGGEGWGYETEPGTEVKPYSPDIGFKDSPDAAPTPCGTSPRSRRSSICPSSASSRRITPAPPCTSP